MKAYEAIFIFAPEVSSDVRTRQERQVEETIKKFNGSITQKTLLGKKPLGYTVRKFRDGFVCHVEFQLEPSRMIELRKAFELQEDLLKLMFTVKNLKSARLQAQAKLGAPVPAPAGTGPAAASHSSRGG